MRIDLIVAARPDFTKAAPVVEEMRSRRPDWTVRTIHTGPKYEQRLAEVLFQHLGMPEPDLTLDIGSGSRTFQTAHVMLALDGQFRRERPDLVMTFGDGNCTLAAALSAAQLHLPVAHVEAGLRSFDRHTSDENNRVMTDAVSELLFISERTAEDNLRKEGIAPEKIHFVGSTIIDTLMKHRTTARALCVPDVLGLREDKYVVVMLHRSSNIDVPEQLNSIVYALQSLADHSEVVFLAPPRTVERLRDAGLWDDLDRGGRLRVIKPLGYLEFLGLTDAAGAVLTDSSSVQEEALVLGTPCVTLRKSTERPVTLQGGGNRLAGDDAHLAVRYVRDALERGKASARIPEAWDGKAASRIVDVLERQFEPGALASRSVVGF